MLGMLTLPKNSKWQSCKFKLIATLLKLQLKSVKKTVANFRDGEIQSRRDSLKEEPIIGDVSLGRHSIMGFRCLSSTGKGLLHPRGNFAGLKGLKFDISAT